MEALAEMNIPEAVAFALLEKIAVTEQWLHGEHDGAKVLNVYAECLKAVRGNRDVSVVPMEKPAATPGRAPEKRNGKKQPTMSPR